MKPVSHPTQDQTPNSSQAGLFSNHRQDRWWLPPLSVALGLGIFGIYSTWAAFQGNHFRFGPYLSPFYSPFLVFNWWHFSPALLILWAPLGFRATCYYYRKAYYRAYFWDPPACAVGDGKPHGYGGETRFPWLLQNLHRFFLYLALIFIVLLWGDFFRSLHFEGELGLGVGSLVLLANCTLLSGYTLGCHSLRHLIGGQVDCFSCTSSTRARYHAWKGVSFLNARHQLWAWMSLFMVGFSDVYIRLCSMGIWKDVRLL